MARQFALMAMLLRVCDAAVCIDYTQLLQKYSGPQSSQTMTMDSPSTWTRQPTLRPTPSPTRKPITSCKEVKDWDLCETSIGFIPLPPVYPKTYGDLCQKSCGSCADDDDGFASKKNWENFSFQVFVNIEVFLIILLVFFFFGLSNDRQQAVFTFFDRWGAPTLTINSSSNSTTTLQESLLLGNKHDRPDTEEATANPSEGIYQLDSRISNELVEKEAMIAREGGVKKQRLYFVDNLRSCLTALVVVHHVGCQLCAPLSLVVNLLVCSKRDVTYSQCTDNQPFIVKVILPWFLTVNQAYFMALFFFISGVFSPSSLRRKGCRLFLKEKVKRLGIPYLMWQLGLGPLLNQVVTPRMIMHAPTLDYNFISGPPWFIRTLLSFNFFYALCPGELPSYSQQVMPSVSALLFFVGSAVGICYSVYGWVNNSTFGVPGGVGYLLAYIAFFAGGLVAGKNDWLRELQQAPAYRYGPFLYCLCGIILFVTFMYFKLMYDYPESNEADYPAYELLKGVWSVAVSLALLNFFAKHANVTGPIWAKINSSAYLVYMIHFYFLNFAIWAFAHMYVPHSAGKRKLVALCGGDIYDTNLDIDWSNSCESGKPPWYLVVQVGENISRNGILWGAFVFASAFALVASWLVSYILKQLPLVRDIM